MAANSQPKLARQDIEPPAPGRQLCLRAKTQVKSITKVGILLALVFLSTATHVGAASGGRTTPRASTLGLALTTLNDRLTVIYAAASHTGLAAWDQIVAVNGRRVSTETAFMHRLVNANGAATVLVNRGGNRITLNLAAGAGSQAMNRSSAGPGGASGFLNPALLVRTPEGVMHIERARRLGLPGVPIEGSPDRPDHRIPRPVVFQQGSGFLNPALLVRTSQGVMHIERARRLGLPGVPIEGSPDRPAHPIPRPVVFQQGSGFLNPALLVRTPQGVMHIERARRLGLPGVPIEGAPDRFPIHE